MTKRVYKTIQGDTWDGIAVKVYGDEKYMNCLKQIRHIERSLFSRPMSAFPFLTYRRKLRQFCHHGRRCKECLC